jgi:SAM-dependent methyltransferase
LARRTRSYAYLLGDSRREAARLRAQARLWDPVATGRGLTTAHGPALFDRLAIRRGWKVLEVGPGQGSLHLELRRRVGGAVDAVERSPVFARRLRALCRRDGLGEGRLWLGDLAELDLPVSRYDLVFARWVFLFLPDPMSHLRKLTRALKPGGLLAIQDYHRDTFALLPPPPEWPRFLAADRAFFASQGGDASIGAKLPELYRKVGLEVVDLHVTVMSGRPGSAVWRWLSDYFFGVMDRYAAHPPFSPADARRLSAGWRARSRGKGALLIAPTVLDVVGRKPRRRDRLGRGAKTPHRFRPRERGGRDRRRRRAHRPLDRLHRAPGAWRCRRGAAGPERGAGAAVHRARRGRSC